MDGPRKGEQLGGSEYAGERQISFGPQSVRITDTEIVNFLLWIETGEEQYKPKQKDEEQ